MPRENCFDPFRERLGLFREKHSFGHEKLGLFPEKLGFSANNDRVRTVYIHIYNLY